MNMPMFVSTRNDLVVVATRILWELDPAKTYCNKNSGMDAEYADEAETIATMFIDENMMLKSAMKKTFDEAFAGHYKEEVFNEAYRRINDYLL